MPEYWSDRMFALADESYVAYSVFSRVPFMPYIALYHLQQAIEKYLKAHYLSTKRNLPPKYQSHDVTHLLADCAEVEPALGDHSLASSASSFNPTVNLDDILTTIAPT